jgi:hypothetical protein
MVVIGSLLERAARVDESPSEDEESHRDQRHAKFGHRDLPPTEASVEPPAGESKAAQER